MSNSRNIPPSPEFEALLQYLKRTRGFDFMGYKRPSLMRLMKKRMQRVGVESYSDYLDYLQVHPTEPNHLFDTLLLNVTKFFRDPVAWEALTQEIIPRIIEAKPNNEPIRAWSAGCASGEEVYTIAIILAEALGKEAFRSRVKIYATDLDEEALTCGRQATYSAKALESIHPELRDKYFEPMGSNYTFSNDLRRCIIFGRHNLVHDAPISRLDLLVCRNTLMYFNADTQARILACFHFALNDTGFLFVGKAEMLLSHLNLFTSVNVKNRIFAKLPKIGLRDRLQIMAEASYPEANNQLLGNMRLRDEAFECLPIAQIIVDTEGNLILVNRQARMLFSLNSQNLGRYLQDFELSYRPLELRSRIQQAYNERRSISVTDVELTQKDDKSLYLDIQVIPLFDHNNNPIGATIIFNDVTRYNELQRELQSSIEELETAYEELQSSNEELETTNEELQSANEELETTNEELQSTNEEQETMNEELQSANEEVQTTNEELRTRTEELNRLSIFMESVLTSLLMGMVVLDSKLSVQFWNNGAEELWGLRSQEVIGHFFLDLDIGLPVEELRGLIRACQATNSKQQTIILNAVNRRGKNILCRVICTQLIAENERQGFILLMDEKLD